MSQCQALLNTGPMTATSSRNLHHDLLEQIAFLDASCRGFDEGLQIEAKRLAVTIRVLVHDTDSSHSLLAQMGIKDRLDWISAAEVNPLNLIPTQGLTSMKVSTRENGSSFEYEPLDSETILLFGEKRDFEGWWNNPVIKDGDGELFSRRALVLALANKDGGAHIDNLQAKVRRLAHEGSSGVMFGIAEGQETPETLQQELVTLNPILASVRTIAEEMRLVFLNQQKIWAPTGAP